MANQTNSFSSNKLFKNFLIKANPNTLFMIRKPQFGLPLLSIFLFMLMAVCTSCSKAHRDGEIKADLATKAKYELNFAGVNYTVENGVVTLTGKCSTQKSKDAVEQMVKEINIVKGLVDRIVIAPVVINADAMLKQTVDSVLKKYPTVTADVSKNIIILEGKAPQKDLGKIMPALNQLHPDKIDNRLQLQ